MKIDKKNKYKIINAMKKTGIYLLKDLSLILIPSNELSKIITKSIETTFYPHKYSIQNQINIASNNLIETSQIIEGIQSELDYQVKYLKELSENIETEKEQISHLQTINKVEKEEFNEVNKELEKIIKKTLDEGKVKRIIFKIIELCFTLLAGGFIGFYFENILNFFSSIF